MNKCAGGVPLGGASSRWWAQPPVWTTTETLGPGGPRVRAWAFLCLQEQGPSPGAVHRCLRLVASLAVEQGFAGTWSSGAVERGLSCFSTRGIFPCQGPNPRPLHRQVGPYPPRHRGSPVSLRLKSGVVGLKAQTQDSWGSGLSPFLLGSAPLGQVVPLLLLFCLYPMARVFIHRKWTAQRNQPFLGRMCAPSL